MCAFSKESGGKELFQQLLAAVHSSKVYLAYVHNRKVKYTWPQSTTDGNRLNTSRESSGQCWVTVNEEDGSVSQSIHEPALNNRSDRIELDDDNPSGGLH